MKLSILICTILEREVAFNKLVNKLTEQIDEARLKRQVEIVYFQDTRGQHTIGHKRNTLVKKAKGLFVVFVDDDDDIAQDYIEEIVPRLKPGLDCVSIQGIMTTDGRTPEPFKISLRYGWDKQGDTYLRFPNHITPIKRSIVRKHPFPNKSYHEDYEQCIAMQKGGLIKKEVVINRPLYYYKFRTETQH